MGVLACDRNGCENIMCDRLSSKYGYICNECFYQLINSDKSIDIFMNSKKQDFVKREIRRETLEKEFVIHDENF